MLPAARSCRPALFFAAKHDSALPCPISIRPGEVPQSYSQLLRSRTLTTSVHASSSKVLWSCLVFCSLAAAPLSRQLLSHHLLSNTSSFQTQQLLERLFVLWTLFLRSISSLCSVFSFDRGYIRYHVTLLSNSVTGMPSNFEATVALIVKHQRCQAT